MKLINLLKKDRRFFGTCPCCDEEIRLADCVLFPVKGSVPAEAQSRITEFRADLKERRGQLKQDKLRMTTRAQTTTASVNLGNIVEKILPTFSSFQYSPTDCRALFDPIDYVIFPGLQAKGTIRQITFVDVKSGQARLTPRQRQIESVIGFGNVGFKQISSGGGI